MENGLRLVLPLMLLILHFFHFTVFLSKNSSILAELSLNKYEFCELFSFCMEYPDNSYRVLNLNTDSIHCQIIYWYTDPTVHSQINP